MGQNRLYAGVTGGLYAGVTGKTIRRSHRSLGYLYAGVTGKTIRRSHRSMFGCCTASTFETIELKNYTPESQAKLYAGVTGH
jgi:hypothetical protein